MTSRADLVAGLYDFIARNPQIFGGVDILNLAYLHSLERAGILAAILTGVVTGDQRAAVGAIVIIVPPETDVNTAHERAWSVLLDTFRLFEGREIPAEAHAWLRARFNVISCPDLRTCSLLALIAQQPKGAAVIVTDSAKYREADIRSYIAPGALTPLVPEDTWVPQVHALATFAVEVARERDLYVAFDTGQLSPTRVALDDLLTSIEGCGVIGSSNDEDPWAVLGKRIDRWDQLIRQGYLGRVLRDIQELPGAFDANKPILRLQMFHRAGLWNETLQAIREELACARQIEPSMRVKLARIAQDAGASRLASEVLSPAVDQLDGHSAPGLTRVRASLDGGSSSSDGHRSTSTGLQTRSPTARRRPGKATASAGLGLPRQS